MFGLIGSAAFLATLVAGAPSTQSLKSSISLLYDNDLQGANSSSASSGLILLSSRSQSDAAAGCAALGEQLWSPELKTASIQANLDYLLYGKKITAKTQLWIGSEKDQARAITASGKVVSVDAGLRLPALCTQTAPFSSEQSQDTSEQWQVTVHSNNEDYTGFRDRLSFRFLGIRYAPEPKRFTYSTPYEGSGGAASALDYGSQCVQSGSGSEDCLFLNIWTNHLPKAGCKPNKASLKPVMFWIHGGAFTSGTANDNTFDGGNLVSRGDVILVAINYRLSTLGFLALDDGVTNGNYGLADQINALDWVRAHIADFGGDPDRITVFGQSAGAGSVRAMMASPKAVGKFANAIPLSNLGGINYGTTYSEYYTIKEEVAAVGDAILRETNCTDAASPVDCLRAVSAATLTTLNDVARYLVVDGTYLTTANLTLTGPAAPYNLMMGIMHDDGGPMINYPTTTNESAYLASAGFAVPDPVLFPIPAGPNATLNLYNMSARLATDGVFRCADQATVARGLATGLFPKVYYYEFDKSYQVRGWPMTSVCDAPKTPSHPNGDPALPYFKCHSGELLYVFGNLAWHDLPYRDANDLPFERFVLDAFASFARTADPNPDEAFLRARGFGTTLAEVRSRGRWEAATEGALRMRVLDWPVREDGFRELAQCEGLGLGLDYWG